MSSFWKTVAICATVISYTSCGESAQEAGLGHHDHSHAEHGHEHGGEHSHSEDEHSGENHKEPHYHGGEEIILSCSAAEQFGVKTQKIVDRDFNDVIKVSGQIVTAPDDQSVVSASSSGIITFSKGIVAGKKVSTGTVIASISSKGITGGDPNEAARIAFEAAKQELERITPLHADGIVSTKDYNAVVQRYNEAKAAYSGSESGSNAIASSSGAITQLLVKQGEYVLAGQPIATISGNTRLTLRADLPEKYYNLLPSIATANFKPAYSDAVIVLKSLNGTLVSSPTTSVSQQNGYLPIYFSFDNNGSAVPGAFVEVYLLGKTRQNCIVVPIDAVTEQQGTFYVYVKLDSECYEKRLVTLGYSNGSEVEIKSGLHSGEVVVTEGAVIVKIADNSGAVPQGHSHNH